MRITMEGFVVAGEMKNDQAPIVRAYPKKRRPETAACLTKPFCACWDRIRGPSVEDGIWKTSANG
jgi:hypothetical protein